MRHVTRSILALMMGGLFVATMMLPFFIDIPSERAQTVILATQQVVLSVTVMVLTFYFGSSQSSQAKDQTIADLSTPPPPPVAPDTFWTKPNPPEPPVT